MCAFSFVPARSVRLYSETHESNGRISRSPGVKPNSNARSRMRTIPHGTSTISTSLVTSSPQAQSMTSNSKTTRHGSSGNSVRRTFTLTPRTTSSPSLPSISYPSSALLGRAAVSSTSRETIGSLSRRFTIPSTNSSGAC